MSIPLEPQWRPPNPRLATRSATQLDEWAGKHLREVQLALDALVVVRLSRPLTPAELERYDSFAVEELRLLRHLAAAAASA